jgi:hypothetical protein
VTQSAGDCGQLIPMTDAIEINLGRKPEQLSAAILILARSMISRGCDRLNRG